MGCAPPISTRALKLDPRGSEEKTGEKAVEVLVAGLVMTIAGGMAALLAYLARRTTRAWPVTGALLLGADDSGSRGVDLRFTAVVAAVVTLLVSVVAYPSGLRSLSPGELTFLIVLSLPLVAGGLALAADTILRLAPESWRPESEISETVCEMLDGARREVAEAMANVVDPSRVAALEALTEAVSEYDRALERNGETARHLRKTLQDRLQGVVTLARSCCQEERREASQVLGVRIDASHEQIDAVYQALSKIYTGPQALAGVDAVRQRELEAAHRRLQTRPRTKAA